MCHGGDRAVGGGRGGRAGACHQQRQYAARAGHQLPDHHHHSRRQHCRGGRLPGAMVHCRLAGADRLLDRLKLLSGRGRSTFRRCRPATAHPAVRRRPLPPAAAAPRCRRVRYRRNRRLSAVIRRRPARSAEGPIRASPPGAPPPGYPPPPPRAITRRHRAITLRHTITITARTVTARIGADGGGDLRPRLVPSVPRLYCEHNRNMLKGVLLAPREGQWRYGESTNCPSRHLRPLRGHEWRNGLAILAAAHREEWGNIVDVLRGFNLLKSDILKPGGSKGLISSRLDSHFTRLGWAEKKFDTKIVVDTTEHVAPTHKVDCYKKRVALEWNGTTRILLRSRSEQLSSAVRSARDRCGRHHYAVHRTATDFQQAWQGTKLW